MGALKAVVVLLGVLIFAVAGMIGYELYRRADRTTPAMVDKAASHVVTLPKGATIAEMTASGDRLILRLAFENGGQKLIVLDLSKGGATIGSVNIESQP